MRSLLAATALAVALPLAGPSQPLQEPPPERLLLDRVNEARRAAGLGPVDLHPALVDVARARLADAAASGSVEPSVADLGEVARGLVGKGYRASRWQERLVAGSPDPEAALAGWRRQDPAGWQTAILGDYEHLGVAAAGPDRPPMLALLFALPRSTSLWRQTAHLADLALARQSVRDATNALRARRGLRPLEPDPALDEAAQRHAEDMLSRGFYDHRTPEGHGPLQRASAAGYRSRWLAENLVEGPHHAAEAVERWDGSSPHRRNMLSPEAREVGIGVAYGDGPAEFQIHWVMVLGRR